MLGVRSGRTRLNARIPLPLDATVAGNDVLQALIVSPFERSIGKTLKGLCVEASTKIRARIRGYLSSLGVLENAYLIQAGEV
jgi:hypothetical protein